MSVTEATDVRGAAVLSADLSGDGPWRVHGVAIGPDETTEGMSGIKKFWPAETLREAAASLEGKNLVRNHVNNDVDAVVGQVTEARYHPQFGVIYKGEIDEEDLARKVKRERLDVSPRIYHRHVDELEENEDGALVVDWIKEFANLALVPRGAAESNKIRIGESGMLSHSQLRAEFGDDDQETDDPQQDDQLDIEDPVGGEDEGTETNLGDRDADEPPEDDDPESDPDDGEEEEENSDGGEESNEMAVLAEIDVLGVPEERSVDVSELEILHNNE